MIARITIWWLPATTLLIVLTSSGHGLAHGEPEVPMGYFEGTLKSKQAGDLEVTLNLRDAKGRYEGELSTPLGYFVLKEGSFEERRLRLRFDTDFGRGTIEARVVAGVLRGTTQVGDDAGTIELRRVGDPKPPAPAGPVLNFGTEQWREDLQYLARELPKRHANAFHHVSRARFEAAVVELDRRLGRLDGDEIYVGLDKIATLIGDAHTYVAFPADTARLPLAVEQFGDECRVVRVARDLQKALGTRVVKVQDTPIARAREILLSMTPRAETPALAQARVTSFLTLGLVLRGMGISPDRNKTRWTLADDDGREFVVEAHALRQGQEPEWVSVCPEPPLYRRNPEKSFWHKYLPDSRTVYCSFRGYRDLRKEAGALLALVGRQRPDKLVIDLRQNGGGDYTEGLTYLIDPIRDLPINAKGHLFVLIGPHTFSAAMSNSAHFRSRTTAILVGAAIGERPNSYQEVRQMALPNSRLIVRFSTRYYKFVESDENVIRPAQEIIPSWAEYKAGRDPVLEWVLKYQAP
jgi:hypothetical protein